MPNNTSTISALTFRQRAAGLISLAWPWLLFAALLAWGWRTTDLFHTIPSYGDVLEGLWALRWYDDAVRLGSNSALYPLAFHPVGFHVPTYAWGPANFILLIPLYRIGGAAFAYNVATLISFVIAFAGAYLLAQRFVPKLGATVAALLYTFWGFRWYGIIGQLNVNLGSALLPWILWSLDRGLTSPRRSWAWCVLAGVVWALAVNSSAYYIWIGGFAVLAWLVGWLISGRVRWRALLGSAGIVLLPAVVLSLPSVISFWQASVAVAAPPFTIYDLNVLGASINSLPIPYLSHPFLQAVAKSIYHGATGSEAGMANLGLLACLCALVGLAIAWRAKAWRPVLVLGCVGMILALGLTLRWDDRMVQVGLLRPLNRVLWGIGHSLNPRFFFMVSEPLGDFKEAVPLPGLLLAALVPYFAAARVLARYALLAGIAVCLLSALALSRVRRRWLQLVLAGLLIFEVLPPPTLSYAFPPPSHPAFDWLQQQSLGSDGIVELSPDTESRLELPGGGNALWATLYHKQATTGGPGGIWPPHTSYLVGWLAEHPHPFQDADFIPLLRFYRVKYAVLHMRGASADDALKEAQNNAELQLVDCFPPVAQAQLYGHPICVLEVRPARSPNFNLLLREGWSGQEDWGRWIDGTEARAQWVATARDAHQLRVQAFPYCVPDQEQQVAFYVNDHRLSSHRWTGCEPWSEDITIPGDLVRVGLNDLIIRADQATRPADHSSGESQDPRALSVGFTELRVDDAE